MAKRICPWWLGYVLASPLRRLLQDPAEIIGPYIREGMTVLEPGPGMGFFTLEMAQRVGPQGRVIAVDVQPRMIAGLKRRLAKVGLAQRVDARLAREESMGLGDLAGKVDSRWLWRLCTRCPAPADCSRKLRAAMKPGAILLLAEPSGHVKNDLFAAELQAAADAGFTVAERPTVRRSHAALLKKLGTA